MPFDASIPGAALHPIATTHPAKHPTGIARSREESAEKRVFTVLLMDVRFLILLSSSPASQPAYRGVTACTAGSRTNARRGARSPVSL
jgi:hypothetical protein